MDTLARVAQHLAGRAADLLAPTEVVLAGEQAAERIFVAVFDDAAWLVQGAGAIEIILSQFQQGGPL